jgi:hypothetical protein
MEFLKRSSIIRNMLEHMAAKNDVETVARKINVRDIHSQSRPAFLKVSTQITHAGKLSDQSLNRFLRCNVQNTLWRAIEEIRPFSGHDLQQSVAL